MKLKTAVVAAFSTLASVLIPLHTDAMSVRLRTCERMSPQGRVLVRSTCAAAFGENHVRIVWELGRLDTFRFAPQDVFVPDPWSWYVDPTDQYWVWRSVDRCGSFLMISEDQSGIVFTQNSSLCGVE